MALSEFATHGSIVWYVGITQTKSFKISARTINTSIPPWIFFSQLSLSLYKNDCALADLSVKLLKTIIGLVQDNDQTPYRQAVDWRVHCWGQNHVAFNAVSRDDGGLWEYYPLCLSITSLRNTVSTGDYFQFFGTGSNPGPIFYVIFESLHSG